jgi:hypothetical protein
MPVATVAATLLKEVGDMMIKTNGSNVDQADTPHALDNLDG